jgi:UDP-glucose 4-epimerase
MKIVVAGGSGFIGSHVADALSDAGHEVTIYDLRESPYLRDDQRFVQGSMLDRDAVNKVADGKDVFYNFAGIPHLDIGLNHPIETVEQNILAPVIALEACRLASIKRYVYASSIYVYSEHGSFYRCSKQAAELYVEEYQRLHGLDYTILRYGTVYGPRADDYNSVRRLLKMALFERKLTTSATGDEVREYIHVRDAASSSVRILSDEFQNEHVVLTGLHAMKFLDMLAMIREIVGLDVELKISPPDASDPRLGSSGHFSITPYCFRPQLAKKLVNNPYIDMGQGLLDCIEEIYHERQSYPEHVEVSQKQK